METISDNLVWLEGLKDKSVEEKTRKSVEKLVHLIHVLEAKNVFVKDPLKILQRLNTLRNASESNPERTNYYVNRCHSDVMVISSKFFNLVKKNHYQNEWAAYGTSFGLIIGAIIFMITSDVIYFVLGTCVGIPFGVALGAVMDKKAAADGRILE